MIDLHNAGPLIAEVTRLREEVADLRAIDTTADEFVDALIAAWPAEDGPVPTEPMEAARYGLRRHLRRLREEVAALKADADRLYDATGFTVPEMIAHDEAMDAQAAALKAEVASLSARFEEACADATRAEADRDAWHNIANKHEAEAQRLAGVAREACDVADRAIEANEILPSTNSERIADLRAAIPTPDPAAFVARPLADYHEDDGNVLWWKFPINEPPYVGSTLDDDWPGYHTHWTPMPPCPVDPALLALGGVR